LSGYQEQHSHEASSDRRHGDRPGRVFEDVRGAFDDHAHRAEQRHAREFARELSHRMKNMFAVIGGIVSITGRARGIEAEAREINDRIQALGRAYEATLDEAWTGSIEIGQAIRSVLDPYDVDGTRFQFEGNGLRSDFAAVSVLGLSLHELAVSAMRNGALSEPDGFVTVRWSRKFAHGSSRIVIDWIEHGRAHRQWYREANAGTGIVDRVLGIARGNIMREWRAEGLRATMSLPIQEGAA
jgi:two-component sensor histidine kinase